jgi:3'-phosphoadenosine 5'-phosphosulfate sulfotransferase (PAPS reductase)/FAD synthetase
MARKLGVKDVIGKTDARHVLGLSGGKDSAALAVYIKDKYPDIHSKIEYFFTDTGAELKEVYDLLDKLEGYLGKEIVRLGSGKTFEDWLTINQGFLPSAKQRWCTNHMKIKPFEKFVGEDEVISYIGIRADENREGYISKKETISAVFPFVEDGLVREDIFKILNDSVGIPAYYSWRSRSGCYFCFFQRQDEWLGLKRNHPDLFEKAKAFEQRTRTRYDWKDGETEIPNQGYTWSSAGPIDELVRRAEEREEKGGIIAKTSNNSGKWLDAIKNMEDDDPEDQACLICSL